MKEKSLSIIQCLPQAVTLAMTRKTRDDYKRSKKYIKFKSTKEVSILLQSISTG